MPIKLNCPNAACGREADIPEDRLGQAVRCKSCGTRFPTSLPTEGAGSPSLLIGRYQVRERLGSGAFGTVYRAYDPQLDREVALKVLRPEALSSRQAVERFQREARASAKMHHPHIVPVYDAGRHREQFFIASAFIRGERLAAAIPETGMDAPRAARLAMQLSEALGYAHDQGILHRDIKPGNIMLDARDTLYLMDFGLASWTQEAGNRLTKLGAVLGTPAFMAPEQARGDRAEIGPAADLYSAGVVLYEMLTGRVPFEGPVPVVVYQVIHTLSPPPSRHRADLDAGLESICRKAMAKNPGERFSGGEEMAGALRAWLAGRTPNSAADRTASPPPPNGPTELGRTSKASPFVGEGSVAGPRPDGGDHDTTSRSAPRQDAVVPVEPLPSSTPRQPPAPTRPAPVMKVEEITGTDPASRPGLSPTQPIAFGRAPNRRRSRRPRWLVPGGVLLCIGITIAGLAALFGRTDRSASLEEADREERETARLRQIPSPSDERKKDPKQDGPAIGELPGSPLAVEKWLDEASNPATKRMKRDTPRHRELRKLFEKSKGKGDVIFIGDSAVQGWEGQKAWEEYFGEFNPVNLGVGGDQTGHVLWRITEGRQLEHFDPKVAVIIIGTNNTLRCSPEQTAGGIKAVVEELKRQKPRMKILLCGIFPKGNRKDADKGTGTVPASKLNKKIPAINAMISKLADGKTVFYQDIGKDLLTPEGDLSQDVMVDYMHLSAKGYAIWGKAIKADLEKLVK